MICERELQLASKKRLNIRDYRHIITGRYPAFAHFCVRIRPMQLSFRPWEEWVSAKNLNPKWWDDYNGVKHHRNKRFHRANLQNVLYSAGGLLIMLIYWYGPLIQNRRLRPSFRILDISPQMDRAIVTGTWLSADLFNPSSTADEK
jgi:hypothetical protein